MTTFQRALLGMMGAGLLLLALLGRYEIVVGARGDGPPPAFVLDRWTGKTELIFGINRRPTTQVQPEE